MSGGWNGDRRPEPYTRDFIRDMPVESPDRTEELSANARRIAAGLPGLRRRDALSPDELVRDWTPVQT